MLTLVRKPGLPTVLTYFRESFSPTLTSPAACCNAFNTLGVPASASSRCRLSSVARASTLAEISNSSNTSRL